ncbi:MAG: copper resistance protein CopC [Pseudomonadota bacterium]
MSLAAGAFIALAGPASAHAMLERAIPAVGAHVAAAPTELQLVFDEPVFADMCVVTLEDAAHHPIALAPLRAGANQSVVIAPLRTPLRPGAYRVHWNAVSQDGHSTEGAYVFVVG